MVGVHIVRATITSILSCFLNEFSSRLLRWRGGTFLCRIQNLFVGMLFWTYVWEFSTLLLYSYIHTKQKLEPFKILNGKFKRGIYNDRYFGQNRKLGMKFSWTRKRIFHSSSGNYMIEFCTLKSGISVPPPLIDFLKKKCSAEFHP